MLWYQANIWASELTAKKLTHVSLRIPNYTRIYADLQYLNIFYNKNNLYFNVTMTTQPVKLASLAVRLWRLKDSKYHPLVRCISDLIGTKSQNLFSDIIIWAHM